MYTKEQASLVRQKFWTSFGRYMQPVPSASGEDVHWINYKTGIRGISFKMNVDNNKATVVVEILLVDELIQHKYFDVFEANKNAFFKIVGNNWTLQKDYTNENNKSLSILSTELNQVNIFRETDWPIIISFLKTNIIALDNFWAAYKVAFELI